MVAFLHILDLRTEGEYEWWVDRDAVPFPIEFHGVVVVFSGQHEGLGGVIDCVLAMGLLLAFNEVLEVGRRAGHIPL
jgi:hypothetical protein